MDAKKLAKQGRNGDTRLAHLTPGEVVAPKGAAPAVRGLLESAGYDPQRYTVGPGASKNPKTGLLEFWGDSDGNDGGDSQGTAGGSRGEGSPGEGGTGGVGEGGGGGLGRDALAMGNEMMGMNNAPLGYGRFTGETVAGTLSRMANNMKEAGYKARNVSDTMSNMGVGYGTRAGLVGYGPAMGTFGRNALNALGRVGGGFVGGPAGSMLGGLLGDAVTGDSEDVGRQFGRNVLGTLASGISSAAGAGPVGGMLASKLADKAFDSMVANAGPAQRNVTQGQAQEGLAAINAQPMQVAPAMQMTQAPGMYNQNAQPNQVQFANVYDPLGRLRMRGLL